MEREVGGGIGMQNTCKPMAVSFQCMTKFTTNKKNILKKLSTSLDHRKSKEVSKKNIYYCFIDYAKAFDSVDHKNCGKLLEMRVSDHLT